MDIIEVNRYFNHAELTSRISVNLSSNVALGFLTTAGAP